MTSTHRHSLITAVGTVALIASLCLCAPASALEAHNSVHEFDAPSGLAFGGGHLWVTNAASSSVTEINPATGDWLATFSSPGFGYVHPDAITAYRGELFVANANGTVTEFRASTGLLLRRITGAAYHFGDPVAITSEGRDILVLNSETSGSVTEFSASTGALVRVIRGAAFAFSHPAAFAVDGTHLWVADTGNDSLTEVDAVDGALIHVIARQGLSSPDGVAIGDGHVWVADMATNAATEIDETSGAVIATKTDADAPYGFGSPSVMVSTGDNIYVASPMGSSPMVTKLSAATGVPSWYMCNTNGPYYFSLLSAFALNDGKLWVASRSGANSKTPGAATGSLTEITVGLGKLVMTLPAH